MSNTDNMRVLAILSTQLTYEALIAGGDLRAFDRPLPRPSVAVDLVTENRSTL
jgi:asparagine synthase (glutamine-hydrolysing)